MQRCRAKLRFEPQWWDEKDGAMVSFLLLHFSPWRFCSKQLLGAPWHLGSAQQVGFFSTILFLTPHASFSPPKRRILLFRFQIGYDRRVRPNYGGPPVTVGVSLYVLSLSEISEKFMDFTFDMYFRYNCVEYKQPLFLSGNFGKMADWNLTPR